MYTWSSTMFSGANWHSSVWPICAMSSEGPNSVSISEIRLAERMKNNRAFEARSVTSSAPHLA